MWENNQLINAYNIYDFDQDNTNPGAFDVTACFEDNESIDFQIALTTPTVRPLPGLRRTAVQLLASSITQTIKISPLRLQNLQLTWTGGIAFLKGTLLDAPPITAKFEYNPGKMIQQSSQGRFLNNIITVSDCATQCNNLQGCTAFDYCSASQVCRLATLPPNSPALAIMNNSNCDFYPLVTTNIQQSDLQTAWVALKNLVFGTGLKVDVPLSGSPFNRSRSQPTRPDQKITLTARWITDQVAPVNGRTAIDSLTIQQFTARPGTQGKGSDDRISGVSVDDCAVACVNELTFTCQSFSYCYTTGTCFMSRHHPDDDPSFLRRSPSCDTYRRNYTSDYEKFDGQTVLSATDAIYQNVISDSACAKLCNNYNGFHCESFDYCSNIRTCFLGRTHYYDVPKANIKQAPACAHYSRSYMADFLSTAHKVVQLRDNRIIQDVTAQECAKLCVQEPGFTCMSFDYCGNVTECRLSDASVSSTGQVTLQASAYCDVFSRQYTAGALQSGDSTSSGSSTSGKYSSGSMAGLGHHTLGYQRLADTRCHLPLLCPT
ncbi:uncharacterized protein LOC112574418 [Pomacea canaliculata]|uniref:uncharacterized protein LOC112574418 n=1 Tax=Pomacea canaliculata TaxID=400727 RepID=UPI000D729423|nr:uncharacterized protein LOC112574418 [Pomacea canaliculata]